MANAFATALPSVFSPFRIPRLKRSALRVRKGRARTEPRLLQCMKTFASFSCGAVALLALPTAAFAQANPNPSTVVDSPTAGTVAPATPEALPEGILIQPRAFFLRNGQYVPLDREIVLSDGTHITSDGTITARDGRILTLPPGQMLSLDGRLVKSPRAADQNSVGTAAPAFGITTTGPARGTISTGPATGTISTGPATGTLSTGPATGTSSTGPATGTTSTGPARGVPSTGPATGTTSSGPATGTTSSGPATGSTSSGPATGTTSSGPARGTLSTGPATGTTSPGVPAR